jgi:hypothetical protein
MKKYISTLVLLVIVSTGVVFAQGSIKATYNIGFLSAFSNSVSESGMGMAFDIDFVDSTGITLGLQFLSSFIDGFVIIPFGMGYTYDWGKWCIGTKFMGVPRWWLSSSMLVSADEICPWGGFGFDVSANFWLTQGIGVSGMFDIFFLDDVKLKVIMAGVGISIRH